MKSKGISSEIKRALLNVAYPLIAFAVILAVWAIAAAAMGNTVLLPYPGEVIKRFFTLHGESGFWQALGMTTGRILETFAISLAISLAAALAGALWKPFDRIMAPVNTVLRAAPTMAVILLAMLWIEYEQAPVLIGFLVAYPVMYTAFHSAFTGIPKELTEMAKVYDVPVKDRITGIYLPMTMPAVFDTSRTAVSLTVKVVIAAEVLAYVRESMGLQMLAANREFDVAALMAWTVLAIVLSFVLEGVIIVVKKLWEARR